MQNSSLPSETLAKEHQISIRVLVLLYAVLIVTKQSGKEVKVVPKAMCLLVHNCPSGIFRSCRPLLNECRLRLFLLCSFRKCTQLSYPPVGCRHELVLC